LFSKFLIPTLQNNNIDGRKRILPRNMEMLNKINIFEKRGTNWIKER